MLVNLNQLHAQGMGRAIVAGHDEEDAARQVHLGADRMTVSG